MESSVNKENTNKNQIKNNSPIIENNLLDYKKELNRCLYNYEQNLQCESNAIKALIKLDMAHATNNYYNNIIESRNTYKVFIRPDGKPDYGNYAHFNRYVQFDPEKYKRPEIYYGYVHDQYIVPQILYGKVKNDKNKENENEKNNIENKKEDLKSSPKNNNIKIKNNQKAKVSTIKSLDDIMKKYKLKYIESPPKEKKVEPPPEEEVPPEEEEDTKDKNKGKKDNGKAKANIKDDKTKNTKTSKK